MSGLLSGFALGIASRRSRLRDGPRLRKGDGTGETILQSGYRHSTANHQYRGRGPEAPLTAKASILVPRREAYSTTFRSHQLGRK
jgi:hypothetical protein